MKNKKQSLRPISILLPGLLAVSAYGGYNNGNVDAQTANTGMSGVVNSATGYTEAKYDKSGVGIDVTKQTEGYDPGRAVWDIETTYATGVSFAVVTAYWSSVTYSDGRARVWETPAPGHYSLARVWN
jgi:hypothetical protein